MNYKLFLLVLLVMALAACKTPTSPEEEPSSKCEDTAACRDAMGGSPAL